MDGFLLWPTTPANNPGVTLAAANTFPIGYYTNLNPDGTRKMVPDLPVIGALAEHYTTLDRYFCAFADADASTAALSAGTSFIAACENQTLPNVCYIDPAFDNEGNGTSGDDHPLGDIRHGERFIADAYHALADNGYLDDTVFIVTFDEWGGFYDHVPPPRVIDDTNPANVMHAGDSTTSTHATCGSSCFPSPRLPASRCRRPPSRPARA
jgi:hypothetical protein